ncbi:hypothetical protein DFH06DRAFT_1294416 [Mycena polygramma]|nr:hypothetical protein DFH06DRAFT_1294416 [Mycena polygramma]
MVRALLAILANSSLHPKTVIQRLLEKSIHCLRTGLRLIFSAVGQLFSPIFASWLPWPLPHVAGAVDAAIFSQKLSKNVVFASEPRLLNEALCSGMQMLRLQSAPRSVRELANFPGFLKRTEQFDSGTGRSEWDTFRYLAVTWRLRYLRRVLPAASSGNLLNCCKKTFEMPILPLQKVTKDP